MKKHKAPLGSAAAGILAVIALYGTLLLLLRADTSDEFAAKPIAAIVVIFFWPAAFLTWKITNDKSEYGIRWGSVIFETLLIAFVVWLISAQVMYMENSRIVKPEEIRGDWSNSVKNTNKES